MEEPRSPAYFAIITGPVLDNRELAANAKILYASITSMTDSKGYCWASNQYLADRFGFRKTAAVSLALSAVLLLLARVHPMAGTAAIFLFNMTMPLTLWASARLLPSARGFAFGLLTFGLFMGFLPAAFGVGLSAPMAAAGALASLALLLPGLGKAVGK